MHVVGLECPACRAREDPSRVATVCPSCGGPLLARYDLAAIRASARRESFREGPRSLWRFAPLLPVEKPEHRLTLGEGMTPLVRAPRLAEAVGLPHLLVKDEGVNPTGTFKARGLCAAVSKATELGVRRFAVPTAGNAGVALAAYAAVARAEATVFVPADAPPAVVANARALGAEVRLVPGLISDAARACAAFVAANPGVHDVSTLKEPYRVEGKKTMGLELALDFDWKLPDVVVYPTGGGTGIVGMAKAFEEVRALGWTTSPPPRLVSVQSEGCAPVVRAFRARAERVEPWTNASTVAAGLRVPKPFADRLVLAALRDTGGDAVAVPDEEILAGASELARDGILASPEGGAAVAGLRRLAQAGGVRPADRVVLFNTGSALAYGP